jgi:hypothetical protein
MKSHNDNGCQENISSPTVSTESTLITAVIQAKAGRDVPTCDIPTHLSKLKLKRKIMMEIVI